MEKAFKSETSISRSYGPRMASAILARMRVLRRARNLEEVPADLPDRRHQLSGNRKGQFAVDLVGPHRLVFEPSVSPPLKVDGGIDLELVDAITILEVVDYH